MAAKKKTKPRPSFHKVSDEMRRWSALIADEVISWPRITTRKMFGMLTFYRGGIIFAGVPDKRSFFREDSVIFKFPEATSTLERRFAADDRIIRDRGPSQKWFGYELREEGDIAGALDWIGKAYELARPAKGK